MCIPASPHGQQWFLSSTVLTFVTKRICVEHFSKCALSDVASFSAITYSEQTTTWLWASDIACVYLRFYFLCLQKLQQELEFLEVQEEYIKDEQKNLKKEFLHAQEEVKRIQSIPLVIGQFLEAVDQNTAIVGSTTGNRAATRVKF